MLSSTYSGILPIMLGSPFSYQLTECTDHINKHTFTALNIQLKWHSRKTVINEMVVHLEASHRLIPKLEFTCVCGSRKSVPEHTWNALGNHCCPADKHGSWQQRCVSIFIISYCNYSLEEKKKNTLLTSCLSSNFVAGLSFSEQFGGKIITFLIFHFFLKIAVIVLEQWRTSVPSSTLSFTT